MLLPGKVAIITGAATGIGQTGARLFAQEGAKVVIADINDKDGKETVKGIREQGNEATFIHADVTSVSDIESMVKVAEKEGISQEELLKRRIGRIPLGRAFLPWMR